ncbi:MAG: glycoside hydrolase 43 family protein [Prevotellaceae bacterium]|jgi:beta-xylosidase|nr:glycoside hydrolase 43 family protein [Prevotellaceae bacterium]
MLAKNKIIVSLTLCACALQLSAQGYVSQVWAPDQGNGTYKNPVLYADYSDPDVCCAGDDYYMTSSSFSCIPGLQILHSRDLVSWSIVGYAIDRQTPDSLFARPQHGNGVWAPSIRYHKGEFYIFYGDPDFGIYMVKAQKPDSTWEKPVLVKAGKGLIDACPLWDDDGKVYLAHAYAGSRAGIKSLLAVCRLSDDASAAISEDVIVYDGHDTDETIEGPKLYKRNGYYYIFAPAGGVPTGWQLALRSKSVYGPYERRVVLAQGNTDVNGPHQGAWVSTAAGEDWFLHFQDMGAYGRVVHLQPMAWKNDFPVIGEDPDGDGTGAPVRTHAKPKTAHQHPVATPAESDDFTGSTLGLQWQWHANPKAWWAVPRPQQGQLRLYAAPAVSAKNMWDVGNLLLQKFPAPEFTATAELTFRPSPRFAGEKAGLIAMGLDYAQLYLENTKDGITLSQSSCTNADKGAPEALNATLPLGQSKVYLRLKVSAGAQCTFFYSLDGKKYLPLGSAFAAKEGKWIGAKVGLYITRPVASNDGGWIDVERFRVGR